MSETCSGVVDFFGIRIACPEPAVRLVTFICHHEHIRADRPVCAQGHVAPGCLLCYEADGHNCDLSEVPTPSPTKEIIA